MGKEHTLWVEKHRPNKLEDYLTSDETRERLQAFIDKGDIPHCIFAGSAGKGKSTIAKLLVKNIPCDYLYINASDENGIETIREKVKSFASSASFQPLKVIILEEASYLTGPAQEALKNIIEEYSLNTRFLFTCNHLDRIVEPIRSRCEGNIFTFTDTPKGHIAKRLAHILEEENVAYDIKDVAKVINYTYPDIRSAVGLLQAGVKDDEFTWKEPNNDWLKQVVEELKKRDKKAWYTIRQIVADTGVDDFIGAYRYMFDNLETFSFGADPEISIILDDFIWRGGVVPDKEINFAACIAKILEANKKQIL